MIRLVTSIAGLWLLAGTAVVAKPLPPPPKSIGTPFDGSAPIVADLSGVEFAEVATIEMWLAPRWDREHEEEACALDVGGAFSAIVSAARDQLTVLGKAGAESKVSLDFTDGEFHHIALFPGPKATAGLIDGERSATFETVAPAGLTLAALSIGACDGANAFVGAIAGLRLWRKRLSAQEVRASAAQSASSDAPPLAPGFTAVPSAELIGYLAKSGFNAHSELSGAWIARANLSVAQPQPATIGDLDSLHHGVYETIPYLGFTRDPAGKRLLLCEREDPLALSADDGGGFRIGTSGATLTLGADGDTFEISADVGRCGLRAGTYVRAERGGVPTGDQPWTGAFVHRSGCTDAAVLGWNVGRMDLPPALENTGARSAIFGLPDGKSKNWRPSATGLSIPWGLVWSRKDLTETSVRHRLITSEQELQSSVAGGESYGAQVLTLSLHGNRSFQKLSRDMYQKDWSYTTTDLVATSHALVLDKRNARLSRKGQDGTSFGFADAVATLSDGISDAEWRDFVEQFGLHYAYAVTCGGRGHQRIVMDGATVASLVEEGTSIRLGAEASAEGTVEGMKLQLGTSKEREDAHSSLKKMRKSWQEETQTFRCYGSINCLGVPHEAAGEEIPVWLDLRPVWELLGPPFYTDYAVAVRLRDEVRKRTEQALTGDLDSRAAMRFVTLRVTDFAIGDDKPPELAMKLLKVVVECPDRACSGRATKGLSVLELHRSSPTVVRVAGSVKQLQVALVNAANPDRPLTLANRGTAVLPGTAIVDLDALEASEAHPLEIMVDVRGGLAAHLRVNLNVTILTPAQVLSGQSGS